MVEIIGILIATLCYACAAIAFSKKYLKISHINETLFLFLCICGKYLINDISKCNLVPYIIFPLLSHIFFICLIVFLFRGTTEKKMLAASLFIVTTTLATNFFESFFSSLLLFWLHMAKKIPVPILGAWEGNIIHLASLVMAILAFYFISRHSLSFFYGKTGKWHIALAIPLLAITLVIDIANWGASNGILVRSGGNMGLYYDQLFSHCGFCILTVLSMFATGFYVFGIDRIYLEQRKSSQYHAQITAYQMLDEQYRMQERLRHDLKNHIIALYGLLENKEWEKMKNCLKNMEGTALLDEKDDPTGNRVVDMLLCNKREVAERNHMIWECDVKMPSPCRINDFDLCVLFGNILDNAIESCQRQTSDYPQPWIRIHAGTVKKCFLIEVKNSISATDRQIVWHSNKDTDGHGIGLLNIGDAIRKYNGVMNIEAEKDAFVISLLIPLGDAEHDIQQAV